MGVLHANAGASFCFGIYGSIQLNNPVFRCKTRQGSKTGYHVEERKSGSIFLFQLHICEDQSWYWKGSLCFGRCIVPAYLRPIPREFLVKSCQKEQTLPTQSTVTPAPKPKQTLVATWLTVGSAWCQHVNLISKKSTFQDDLDKTFIRTSQAVYER